MTHDKTTKSAGRTAKKDSGAGDSSKDISRDYNIIRRLGEKEEPSSWTESTLAIDQKSGEKVLISKLNRTKYTAFYGLSAYSEEKIDTYQNEVAKKYEDKMKNFVDSRKKVAGFSHPNIAQVLKVGKDNKTGEPIVIIEYVEGKPVYQITEGMSVVNMMSIFLSVLDALSFMHRKGILHLNIKSQHILVYAGDVFIVKLTDYGFAADKMNIPENIIGTALYAAPEVILMVKEKIGESSDLYSLAVLIYACMARNFPFNHRKTAKNAAELKEKVFNESVPMLPSEQNHKLFEGIANPLTIDNIKMFEELIVQQLKPNPNDRPFKTAAAFREKIKQLFPEALDKKPVGDRTLTVGTA
ncbi:MAG: protein kinase [Pseudomonadota bacterium]